MSFLKMGALVVPALAAMAMSAHASPCNNGYGEGSSGIVADVPLTLHAVIAEVRRVSPEVRTAGL
ncbi:MAG: TolC family protein, partial [Henriciella sp.]|nr:TolC family protein [Henriciella sp.]